MGRLGIRRENKSRYERRAAISPEQVGRAVEEFGLDFVVEPSEVRVFDDGEYAENGAQVSAAINEADVILGVKEIPAELLVQDKAYVYFSHTIKGQDYNMAMLQRLLDLNCTLIDYERIAEANGRRLVFFGYHAGLAGMIDSLWILGQKWAEAGYETPLSAIRQAFHYEDLAAACRAIRDAGEKLREQPLPVAEAPFVVGFAGYGNVSRGAQFVFEHLRFEEVTPDELPTLIGDPAARRDCFYKVVFKEQHMARRIDGSPFVLQDYYDHPELFEGTFESHLPYLGGLVNCIYWEPRYPKLVTRSKLQRLHEEGSLRLRVIGDITCDIDGSVETTTKATDQDHPILMYDPATDRVTESTRGPGVATLAVDNLPCELPRDSTRHFGDSLYRFLPDLAAMDRTARFAELALCPEVKRAVIVWNGELTPDYEYLREFLK